MGKWINEHLIPKILAFVNTKAVQSIKDGMVYTMPRGNPKFCVTAKSGANREKFIMGGRRVKRLPPC